MSAQDANTSAPRLESTAQQASGGDDSTAPGIQVESQDEEFQLTTFEPTNADEEDQWADLPHLPGLSREARHALHNTSIDPENPPRTTAPSDTREGGPPAERERQHEHEARRQQAILEEQAREEEILRARTVERARQTVDERADAAADKLMEHYRVVQSMLDAYNSSRDRYEQEFPQSFGDFQKHTEYAAVVSQEDVRFYSMLLWFQRGVPQYFTLALRDLVRAYYEESRLREELGRADKDDDGHRNTVSQADGEAAAAANVAHAGGELEIHGMEIDSSVHINTIGAIAIPHFDDVEQEEKFIRACFELRKVRLEHGDSHELRHPHCRPYEITLDHSMEVFCRRARATFLNENGQPRQPLASTFVGLLKEMETYAATIVRLST